MRCNHCTDVLPAEAGPKGSTDLWVLSRDSGAGVCQIHRVIVLRGQAQLQQITTVPVGTHEHCEAAIAVCLMHCHRGLAVLVRSYRGGAHLNSAKAQPLAVTTIFLAWANDSLVRSMPPSMRATSSIRSVLLSFETAVRVASLSRTLCTNKC